MRIRPTIVLPVWFGLAALGGLAGCGKEQAKLYQVEGQVTVGGKALVIDSHKKGNVALHPYKEKGNESLQVPDAVIDSEGNYKIKTYNKAGVALGWYKVVVTAAKVHDPKNPYHTASDFLVPERYRDVKTTPLAFEVVENPTAGAYDLKLDEK